MAGSSERNPYQLSRLRRILDCWDIIAAISAVILYPVLKTLTSKPTNIYAQELLQKIDKIKEGLLIVADNIAYLKATRRKQVKSSNNESEGSPSPTADEPQVGTELPRPLDAEDMPSIHASWRGERPARLSERQEEIKKLMDEFRKVFDYPFSDKQWEGATEYWLRKQWEGEELEADRKRSEDARLEKRKQGPKL